MVERLSQLCIFHRVTFKDFKSLQLIQDTKMKCVVLHLQILATENIMDDTLRNEKKNHPVKYKLIFFMTEQILVHEDVFWFNLIS